MTRPPATRAGVDETVPADPPAVEQVGATRVEPARRLGSWREWSWRERLPHAVEMLALLPLLGVLRLVMTAPLMPYQDYWDALYRITNPDGSPHWRGFFTYQNEHPFTIPSVIFYLGARLGDGDNRTLGYYTVLVVAVSVVLLRRLLPRAWSPMARAWVTVAIGFVLFCPAGLWNFVRGMSGTAWLTANLFAIVAILLATRRWTVLAILAACLAVLSYGTGFGAFVGIAVVAFVLRQGRWRVLTPLGLLAVTAVIWIATSHGGTSGGGISRNPALLASTLLSNLGLLWAPTVTEMGVLLGAAGLAVLAVAGGVVWRRRTVPAPAGPDAGTMDAGTMDAGTMDAGTAHDDELAPWWGLAGYAVAAAALISLGRSETFGGVGVQSRYVSLPALFWVAVSVVALRVLLSRQLLMTQLTVIAGAVLVFYAQSIPLAGQAVAEEPAQQLLATAVRLDAADSFGARFQRPNEVVPRLKALGHYPFNGRYSLGCGGLTPGDTIDLAGARPVSPTAARIDSDVLTVDSRYLRGWLRTTDQVRCVLLVDRAGKVVGGGTFGFSRPDVAATTGRSRGVGWEAIAPPQQKDVRVVVGFDSGYRTVPAPTS
ncbi:MAG: hypothetical protein ACJ73E_08490 [Mycobacteriales bacterium]